MLGFLWAKAQHKNGRVGVAGHSYGGTTALHHAAVDARCKFACISGAVRRSETRLREGTGTLLFETVPGLARQLAHHDLLSAIGPKRGQRTFPFQLR